MRGALHLRPPATRPHRRKLRRINGGFDFAAQHVFSRRIGGRQVVRPEGALPRVFDGKRAGQWCCLGDAVSDEFAPHAPAAIASLPDTRGESIAHRELKRLATDWARSHRLMLCGTEVRLPRSGYRADVAAATPRILSEAACTAVFECKASRADFRRDAAGELATLEEVTELRVRLAALRVAIGEHRPDLRRGEELFPQFDAIDLRGVRHATHARLTRQLRAAEVRLLEGTKFAKLARWRAATLLYLVAEPDVIAMADVPDGWGLLERAGDTLVLRLKPCVNETSAAERVAFVERIAAKAAGTVTTRRIPAAQPPAPA